MSTLPELARESEFSENLGLVVAPLRRAVPAINTTLTELFFLSITRLDNKSLALAGSAIILGMLIELRQDAFPVFPAIALALGAIIFLEQGLDSRPKNFAAAGVCTGLAACFRHDMGFYLALAATLSIFLDFIFISPETKKKQARIIFAKKMGLYVLGILSIDLPVVGFFIHSVPLSDLYENLILIPSSIYPGMRHLPWPGLDAIKGVLNHPGDITHFLLDAPDNGEAESCAASFCRKIRLKQFLKISRTDPLAIISDLGYQQIAGGVMTCSNGHTFVGTFGCECLGRIFDQVNKHTF